MTAAALSSTPLPAVAPVLDLTMEACGLAQAAVTAAGLVLGSGSREALHQVREHEERLDELDREIDGRVASEVIQATPKEVRQLLACMKLMVDFERIGDLVLSFAERAGIVHPRVEMDDVTQLTQMGCALEYMLRQVSEAFASRDIDTALHVLRLDAELDRLRNMIVIRHTEAPDAIRGVESLHVLFMAQALERAGDHTKNAAEEICHLVSGQTVRHLLRLRDRPVEQMFLEWLLEQHARKSHRA